MTRIYLDWNATTPPHAEVLRAMNDAAREAWGNPSSIHADGRRARAVVEDARAEIASLTGTDARDVLLMSGGTEANNVALRSAARGATILTSRLEHPSITRVAEALAAEGRVHLRWLSVLASGVIDLADLEAALAEARANEAGVLVALQAVNHETGIVQPLAEAIAIARQAPRARVHVDAVQAWGKIDVPAGWDTASLAGHKIRGPKGVGALAFREGASIEPVLLGGAQERGLRPGTTDPVLAAGLGAAARRAKTGPARHASVASLRDALEAALLPLSKGAIVVGDPARRIAHVTNIVWPSWSGAELVAALDLEGVSVSSGAACSAGTVEPSPVLTAMLGAGPAKSGVRASLGEETTDADVQTAVSAFRRVLSRAAAK